MLTSRQMQNFILSNPDLRVPTPMLSSSDGKRIAGTFYVDATLVNGAPISVDLTVQARWHKDHRVRKVYSTSDTTTKELLATLQISEIEVVLRGPTAHALTPAQLQLLHELYLRAQVGSNETFVNLHDAFSTTVETVSIDGNASSATSVRFARSGPVEVPGRDLFVDLENNNLYLQSDVDLALGSDQAVWLQITGALYPKHDGVPGNVPGCGAMPVDERLAQNPRGIRDLRTRARASRLAYRKLRR